MRSFYDVRRGKSQLTGSYAFVWPGLSVLACVVTAVAVFAAMGRSAVAANRPNIIVIISDDQGWNDMGYNDSDVMTPHLDALAKSGVRLDANYVYPVCSPTRVGLLSGRNPSRYRILGPIGGRSTKSLPVNTVTLADALKSAGYFTAISGKWHLGLRPEVGPRQYGFDSTYGYLHGQIDQYTHIYKNGDPTWHRQDKLITEKGHATDLITDEAIRVIETKRRKPFFLYVAYSVPHYPVQEPKEWTSKYDGVIRDRDRREFAASLTHMDAGIGRIVAALEKTGQRRNTIIVYTSDNGGQKSWNAPKSQYNGKFRPNKTLGDNRPLRGWKGDLYEGGIRVPALVNWPATLKPRVVKQTISVLDWFPTLAAIAGVKTDSAWRLEGVDVGAALRGTPQANLKQRPLYWKTGRQSAIRRGNWKLVATRRAKDERYELFDITSDPNEKNDATRNRPDLVAELIKELNRQRQLDRQRR